MKLLTKEIMRRLLRLGATDGGKGEQVVQVKLFCPWSNWTWYVLEADPQENDDVLFFGLVKGHESELGYFSLRELENLRGPGGLRIERDRYYDPRTLKEAAPDFCERLWG